MNNLYIVGDTIEYWECFYIFLTTEGIVLEFDEASGHGRGFKMERGY